MKLFSMQYLRKKSYYSGSKVVYATDRAGTEAQREKKKTLCLCAPLCLPDICSSSKLRTAIEYVIEWFQSNRHQPEPVPKGIRKNNKE